METSVYNETWSKDPDLYRFINKAEPLGELKKEHSVWVSGLMSWQRDHRSSMDVFEERSGIIKFYPLLNVTREEREAFTSRSSFAFSPIDF